MSEQIAHRPRYETVAILQVVVLVAVVALSTQLMRTTSLARAASSGAVEA